MLGGVFDSSSLSMRVFSTLLLFKEKSERIADLLRIPRKKLHKINITVGGKMLLQVTVVTYEHYFMSPSSTLLLLLLLWLDLSDVFVKYLQSFFLFATVTSKGITHTLLLLSNIPNKSVCLRWPVIFVYLFFKASHCCLSRYRFLVRLFLGSNFNSTLRAAPLVCGVVSLR